MRYRLADHISQVEQPQRAGEVKIFDRTSSGDFVKGNARSLVSVMRGRQFDDKDILIDDTDVEEVTE